MSHPKTLGGHLIFQKVTQFFCRLQGMKIIHKTVWWNLLMNGWGTRVGQDCENAEHATERLPGHTMTRSLSGSHTRVLCVRQWPTSFHQLAFSYKSVCNCIIPTIDKRDNPSLCEHQRCPHSPARISTNPVHWEEGLGEEETWHFISAGGNNLQTSWFQRETYLSMVKFLQCDLLLPFMWGLVWTSA